MEVEGIPAFIGENAPFGLCFAAWPLLAFAPRAFAYGPRAGVCTTKLSTTPGAPAIEFFPRS